MSWVVRLARELAARRAEYHVFSRRLKLSSLSTTSERTDIESMHIPCTRNWFQMVAFGVSGSMRFD